MYWLSMKSSSLRSFSFQGFWVNQKSGGEWFSSPPPFLSSEILRVTLSSNRYREVGGRETKLEISPREGREDNVQNNVAVKMKFDQRFNVTSERQDNAHALGCSRGGASLIFAPVGDSWMGFWAWHRGKNGSVMRTECVREIKKSYSETCWPNQTELRIWNWRDIFSDTIWTKTGLSVGVS